MVARGEGLRGGIDREFGTDKHTLTDVKEMINKDLLLKKKKKK